MGKITFNYTDPTGAGDKPAVGSIIASLIRREKVGDSWRTIKAFHTKLTGGRAEIELSDTAPDQLWRVSEVGIEGAKTFHVQVDGNDSFNRMLDVDPDTLEPAPEAVAGWAATLTAVSLKAAEAKASAALAKQYAVDKKGDPGEPGPPGLTIVGAPGEDGEDGAPGVQGPVGMKWRGTWNVNANFAVGDIVATTLGGNVYIATAANVGVNPSNANVVWDLLSQRGQPGVNGLNGTGALLGTGSPEGVITAVVGTKYHDTAATRGAREWYKLTGTGNTGWTCVAGDTGWRDITALMVTFPFTVGKLYIKRVSSTVQLTFDNVSGPGGTEPSLIFPGFRIRFASSMQLSGGPVTIWPGGNLAYTSMTGRYQHATWFTDEVWPLALPGFGI